MSASATDIKVFNLPDVGEGLVEARVVEIKVEEGQAVDRFDVLVEVETDKALVELSSPWTGTVHRIVVAVEDYVEVGSPVLEIAVGDSAAES